MKTINIDMKSVVAAVESLEALSRGFAEAASAFKELVRPFEQAEEQAEEPEPLADKFPAEFEASRPVQAEPPLPPAAGGRQRLGDVGYEDEPNPNRQACGQIGGLATAGVKRAPCPDRQKPGTVMVKDMSVNEKRRYWRWVKYRAGCRAAGLAPVSWTEWEEQC